MLLNRRVDDGCSDVIGEAVDPDESLSDALRREAWERSCLTVCQYRVAGTPTGPSRTDQYRNETTTRIIPLAHQVEVEDCGALRRRSKTHRQILDR